MELLTTHNGNGGSAPVGGIWYLQSSCNSPITLNGTSYNDGDEILGGDNPDIDISSITAPCILIFEYRYGECLVTDTLTINIESGEAIIINELNYYLCAETTSVTIDTSSTYTGNITLNELDSIGDIISSNTSTYPSTIIINDLPLGTENVRYFNIVTDGDCVSTSDTFTIYHAPNNIFTQCQTLSVCEGVTNGIDLNDYITINSAATGSTVTAKFVWLSNESVTLSDSTVVNTGDVFTTSPALTLNTASLTANADYQVVVEYNLQGSLICDIESNTCEIEITNQTVPMLSQDIDYLCRWSDFGSIYLSPQIVPNGSYTIYETDEFGTIQSIFNANSDGTLLLTSLNEGVFYYTFEDNNATCGTQSEVFTLHISPALQAPTCMEIMACTGEDVDLNDGITGGSGVTLTYQFTSSPITPIPLVSGGTVALGVDYVPTDGLIDTTSFSNNDVITYQVTSTHTLSDGTECQRVTDSCDIKIMTCVAPCTDYTTAFTTSPNIITINHITSIATGMPVVDYIATWENLNTGDTFQSANGSYITSSTFVPNTPTQVPVTSGNWQITLVEVSGVVINCLLSETFMIDSSSCDDGGTGFLSYEGPGGITATEFDYTINSSGNTDLFIDLFVPQTVPDVLEIIYEGVVIYTTSTSINNVTVPVIFNVDSFVTVRISNTNPNVNTIWFFRMSCIDCVATPCPTELPPLNLQQAPTIGVECAVEFEFNDLRFGNCALPYEDCNNTSVSDPYKSVLGCDENFSPNVCIDEAISISTPFSNVIEFTFTNNATLVTIQNLISGLSSNQAIGLDIPTSSTKSCIDDGALTEAVIYYNSIVTVVGNTLTITKPLTNPYLNDCLNCEKVLFNQYSTGSYVNATLNNGGSVSSIQYSIQTVTVNTSNSTFYTYRWEDNNCTRLEERYYIVVTDVSDPLNNWEVWSWNGTGSQSSFNTTDWTFYMDNNNPIIGC